MEAELVRRVVGGGDVPDVGGVDELPGREGFGSNEAVGLNPDFLRCFGGQRGVDAEIGGQLHPGPVHHGIAGGLLQTGGVPPKLLRPGGVAGDVILLHAAGPHQPPLVVVTAEHQFPDAQKGPVLVNGPGGQVAVEVDNRQLTAGLVKPLSRRTEQQKVIGSHEIHPLADVLVSARKSFPCWGYISYCKLIVSYLSAKKIVYFA